MKTFHAVLANTLVASVINNFVWFAVTFWVYLQTRSVIATSIMAGVYTLTVAVSGFLLGSLVDRYHKKSVMILSSAGSLALYLLVWFALRETAAGRHVYAVGNNAEAARLMGIPTGRLIVGVHVFAGMTYGLAALLAVARTGVGDPQAGQTDNLDSITAVVLGGTSLFGGRGLILGSLVGALIVGVFRNGLTLMGVASVYQILITGILVILAVTTDQLSRGRSGRP